MYDLKSALQVAEKTLVNIGDFAREGFGNCEPAGRKGTMACNDFTFYDLGVEERIAEQLLKFDSGIGFHGEERGHRGPADTYWVCDPIDGTGHYIRGNQFCTSILALIDNGKPQVCAIYDFTRDEMYTALVGGGAYKNGVAIHVSDKSLEDAYIACEINLSKSGNRDRLWELSNECMALSNINCGHDSGQIATGHLDGRYMLDSWMHIWEQGAMHLLATEAGAQAYVIGDGDFSLTTDSWVVANPRIIDEMLHKGLLSYPK